MNRLRPSAILDALALAARVLMPAPLPPPASLWQLSGSTGPARAYRMRSRNRITVAAGKRAALKRRNQLRHKTTLKRHARRG
jgi:hypothetical protein